VAIAVGASSGHYCIPAPLGFSPRGRLFEREAVSIRDGDQSDAVHGLAELDDGGAEMTLATGKRIGPSSVTLPIKMIKLVSTQRQTKARRMAIFR
jgi:hypothetical protein